MIIEDKKIIKQIPDLLIFILWFIYFTIMPFYSAYMVSKYYSSYPITLLCITGIGCFYYVELKNYKPTDKTQEQIKKKIEERMFRK